MEAIQVDKGSGCSAREPKEAVRTDFRRGLFSVDCPPGVAATSLTLNIPGFDPLALPLPPASDRFQRVDVNLRDLQFKLDRKLMLEGVEKPISIGRNWSRLIGDDRTTVEEYLAAELGRDFRGCGLEQPVTIADLINSKDNPPLARKLNCVRVDLKDWPGGAREALFRDGRCSNVDPTSANAQAATLCVLQASTDPGKPINLGPAWKEIAPGDLRKQIPPLQLLSLPATLAASTGIEAKDAPRYTLQRLNLLGQDGKPLCKVALTVQPGMDSAPWASSACTLARPKTLQLEWELEDKAHPLAALMEQKHNQDISLDTSTLPRLAMSDVMPARIPLQIHFRGSNVPEIVWLRSFNSTDDCTREVLGPFSRQSSDERVVSKANADGSYDLLLSGPASTTVVARLLSGSGAIHDGKQFQSKCSTATFESPRAVLSLDPEPSTQKSYVLLISTSDGLNDWAGVLGNTLFKWLKDRQTQLVDKPDSDVGAFRLVTIGVSGTTESRLFGRNLPTMSLTGAGSIASKLEFNFEGSRQALADLSLLGQNYGNTGIKRLLYLDGQKVPLTEAAVMQQGGAVYVLLDQGVDLSIMTVGGPSRCKEWQQRWAKIVDCWPFPTDRKAAGVDEKTETEFMNRLNRLVRAPK